MNSENFICWKCQAELGDLLLPLSRLSKCRNCKTDLHVCKLCEFYDTTVNNHCREPIADKVNDKTRSNFCGYFQITRVSPSTDNNEIENNKATLESLFGLNEGSADLSSGSEEKARSELDELFGLNEDKT